MLKNKKETRGADTASLAALLPSWLEAKGMSPRVATLVQLWRNWPMVMGRFLAPTAQPLGHRGKTLIIGAEDNLILQDLSMCSEEILGRANAFMGEEFFERVEFRLCLGKVPLNRISIPELADAPAPKLPPRPDAAGEHLDPDSPIGRCYRAYLNLFDQYSNPNKA